MWNIAIASRYTERSKSDVNRRSRGASVHVVRISRVRVTADKSRSSFWQILSSFIEAIYNARKRGEGPFPYLFSEIRFRSKVLYRYEPEKKDISLDKRATSPRSLLLRKHNLATCARRRDPFGKKKKKNRPDKFPVGRARAVNVSQLYF